MTPLASSLVLNNNLLMELPGFVKDIFPGEPLDRIKLYHYTQDGISFIRLANDHKGFHRGTVFYDGGVVPGYPKILRVLHLEKGINRYFRGAFYVEEKMDGYNVRVAVVDGRPLAFTRGGFVCPFTTDRLPELINLNFFEKEPSATLCGEVVGPGSPYNTEEISYIEKDVRFFAFDVIKKHGSSFRMPSPEEKYGFLEESSVEGVKRWGPFHADDIEEVKSIVLGLERDGREGIVVKPEPKGKAVKFVTPSSCLRDLEATAPLLAELPAGFYIQRVMRAVFFSREFGVPLDDVYLLNAAKALYRTNEIILKDIEDGGEIREVFNIKTTGKEAVDSLLHHLRQTGVKAALTSVERTESGYEAQFYRSYLKGTRLLRQRLRGRGFFD